MTPSESALFEERNSTNYRTLAKRSHFTSYGPERLRSLGLPITAQWLEATGAANLDEFNRMEIARKTYAPKANECGYTDYQCLLLNAGRIGDPSHGVDEEISSILEQHPAPWVTCDGVVCDGNSETIPCELLRRCGELLVVTNEVFDQFNDALTRAEYGPGY